MKVGDSYRVYKVLDNNQYMECVLNKEKFYLDEVNNESWPRLTSYDWGLPDTPLTQYPDQVKLVGRLIIKKVK